MPKIDVNKVAEILKKNQIEPSVLRQIVEDMNVVTQPDGGEEDSAPTQKKQHVLLISDPKNQLPSTDFVGWAIQIPEEDSVMTTLDRIYRAVYEFMTTKKGRLLPPKTVGEALEYVPAKHFKDVGVWVKTKIPVLVLKTNNEIPLEKTESKGEPIE